MMTTKSIQEFKMIADSVTWYERLYLGYNYQVWKAVCLYKFMKDFRTNIGYREADVVCNYRDIELEVTDGFKQHQSWAVLPMLFLRNISEKRKYADLWIEVQDSVDGLQNMIHFKKEIDKYSFTTI